MDWPGVEQKVFILFDSTLRVINNSKYLRPRDVGKLIKIFKSRLDNAESNQCAFTTLVRSGGQSSILASSRSPAQIGPTPEGVPVKIKSPGKSVIAWLAKETICATE